MWRDETEEVNIQHFNTPGVDVLSKGTSGFEHIYGDGWYGISSVDQTLTDIWPDPNQPFNQITDAETMMLMKTSGNSILTETKINIGASLSGVFRYIPTAINHLGTVTQSYILRTSDDDITYGPFIFDSFTDEKAQYCTGSVYDQSGTSGAAVVKLPIKMSFTERERDESGTATLTTTQPESITFTTPFSSPPFLEIIPLGTNARIYGVDNKTGTGFDLYLYDTSGTQVAGSVEWRARS